MASDSAVFDQITDSDGDRIDIEADGPDVYLSACSHGFTAVVRLDAGDQERFAQAYVAACHQAAVNREADRVCAELDRDSL